MKRPLGLIGTTLATMGVVDGLQLPDDRPDLTVVPVPPVAGWSDDVVGGVDLPHPSYLNQTSYGGVDDQQQPPPAVLPDQKEHQPQGRRRRLYHSTTGSFHNLVLLLRFADHTSRTLPSQSDIHRLYNSEEFSFRNANSNSNKRGGNNGGGKRGGNNDDIVPTGSVRQVYLLNSHDTFTIETTVVDWITLSHPEAYYADGNHGFTKFKEGILEALSQLDDDNNPAGGGGGVFDFDAFDLDDNGALDGLGILHSGYGAEFGGSDCYGGKNEDRIWSHKGGLDWTSSSLHGNDPIKVNRYYVSSSLRGKCSSNIVRMGVICHELGHYLGLPDLYDGTFDGTGLGAYDFMSQSWGFDGSGLYPPNLSAWSKVKVGWVEPVEIEYDGTYTVEAASSSDKGNGNGNNQVYKISKGYPNGEYLLLENRQPSAYDSKLPQGGIAIYHIDENANGQRYRGYPPHLDDKGMVSLSSTGGAASWPTNGEHYNVALLSADGQYELERGVNHGDKNDLWSATSSMTELKPGQNVFPNTDAYQNGSIVNTGIRIFDFSNSGNTMTFRVKGLGAPSKQAKPAITKDEATVVSLESVFATSKVASGSSSPPPTSAPSSRPTPAPSPEPTSRPTLAPTTSKPVSSSPTRQPATSLPTKSPISKCNNLCLTPIPSSECPSDPYGLPDCTDPNITLLIGELCDGDGECSTNQFLNNCRAVDVYRRVACDGDGGNVELGVLDGMTNWMDDSSSGTAVAAGTMTSATTASAAAPLVSTAESSSANANISYGNAATAFLHQSKLKNQGSSGTKNSSTTVSTVTSPPSPKPTDRPTSSAPSKAPTMYPTPMPTQKPSAKPTVLTIMGTSTNAAASFAQQKPFIEEAELNMNQASEATNNECPYYPGWNIALTYCLKDCHQPHYMRNNPIFEFDTVDGCCSLHFGGKMDCKTQTLMAVKERMGYNQGLEQQNEGEIVAMVESIGGVATTARITGQVWKDLNGNNWQDVNERTMASGIPNVLVDLYQCSPNNKASMKNMRNEVWVSGTRTSSDGSYLLSNIATPGWYAVKVTPPTGYHLSQSGHPSLRRSAGNDEAFDSDFNLMGLSSCMELPIGGEVMLDAGLIPNWVSQPGGSQFKTELVSSASSPQETKEEEFATADEEEENEDNEGNSYSGLHSKSRTSNVPPGLNKQSDANSFLRGSSSNTSSSYSNLPSTSTVVIQPTDDATIHSSGANMGGNAGELLVGPQSSWRNDILLKFDMSSFATDYRLATKAALRLYSLISAPSGGVIHIGSSNDWNESTVTWSTMSSAGSVDRVLGTIDRVRPQSWIEVDVSAILLTEDENGVATIRISSEASNHSWLAKYSSKENSEYPAPELRVYF